MRSRRHSRALGQRTSVATAEFATWRPPTLQPQRAGATTDSCRRHPRTGSPRRPPLRGRCRLHGLLPPLPAPLPARIRRPSTRPAGRYSAPASTWLQSGEIAQAVGAPRHHILALADYQRPSSVTPEHLGRQSPCGRAGPPRRSLQDLFTELSSLRSDVGAGQELADLLSTTTGHGGLGSPLQRLLA